MAETREKPGLTFWMGMAVILSLFYAACAGPAWKIVLCAIFACDIIWRVARIANGEPIATALRMTTKTGLIAYFIVLCFILCWLARDVGWLAFRGDIALRIICGIVSAGSTIVLVVELIYGEKELPVNAAAPNPDGKSESN